MGIISKSGTSYSYGEEKLGRGYDATRQFLKDKANSKIATAILKDIRAGLAKNGGSVVAVSGSESESSD
jgi:hypothetical protein